MKSRPTPSLLALLAAAALACAASCGGARELKTPAPTALVSAPAQLLAPGAPAAEAETARRAFTPVVAPGEGVELADERIAEQSEKRRYKIEFTFPQLEGRLDPQSARFNRVVRALARREARAFKEAFAGSEKYRPWTEEKSWGDVYDSLEGGYQIIHLADDFASVRFDLYTYGRGAAHSVHTYSVLNVDLKTGRVHRLGDLFRPGAPHLQTLAAHSLAELKRQADEEHRREVERVTRQGKPASRAGVSADDLIDDGGAAAEAGNYRAWNLTPEGVVVSFAACQVMSCADGAKEVLVPYSALAAILKDDGPAARLGATRPR